MFLCVSIKIWKTQVLWCSSKLVRNLRQEDYPSESSQSYNELSHGGRVTDNIA